MGHANRIELEIRGDYALFSDPLTSVGGEKLSYPVPTREALKGILTSVYWKPSIIWFPDELRVMNPVSYDNMGVRRRLGENSCDLSEWTVLRDVRYRLRAHFEWNYNRPELAADRNILRHAEGVRRMVRLGGARPVFLGVRRFAAEVSPCSFADGEGFYDNAGKQDFGLCYCGITYPDEGYDRKTRSGLSVYYHRCVMENGVIRYPRPEECVSRFVKPMEAKCFGKEKQLELV